MVLATKPKRSLSIHDKKRQGQHHKPTKSYAKTYWPYLPMLLVVAGAFVLNNFWNTPGRVLGSSTTLSSISILQDTNQARLDDKEQPLSLNNQLSQAAQAKANDMANRDYWSHITPEGKTPWGFVHESNYDYAAVGENLAYGFSDSHDVIQAWLHSKEHRDNLLNDGYKDVGFGVAEAPNYQGKGPQTVVVAIYGLSSATAANIAQSTPRTTTASLAPARSMARGELLFGSGTITLLAITVAATISTIVFVVRHGRMWRKAVAKGEHFIVRHPVLDLLFLGTGAIGYLVTRGVGFIH